MKLETMILKRFGKPTNSWAASYGDQHSIVIVKKGFGRSFTLKWNGPGGMGRFGGGWNFKLGVIIGGSDLIFELIFFYIRISKEKPK
jgi:hypothetical protein